MKTSEEERDSGWIRRKLSRQIWIISAVFLVVVISVVMERQNEKRGVSTTAFIEEMQLSDPVETGSIPSKVLEEAWMKEYGQD